MMKRVLAVLFLCALLTLLLSTVAKFALISSEVFRSAGGGQDGIEAVRSSAAQEGISLFVLGRSEFWVDLYGTVLRLTGVDVIPDEERTVYRLSDGSVTFLLPEQADYLSDEKEGIREIKKAADLAGAESWFVLIPHKYCKDQSSFSARGVQVPLHEREKENKRMENFLREGYHVLDLHEAIHAQGKQHAEMYYQTDHHWTTETALWAARELAQALGLDLSALDRSLFEEEMYAGVFLGSEGKHCGKIYCKPDDFLLLTPKTETKMTLSYLNRAEEHTGSFSEALLFRENISKSANRNNEYGVFLNGDASVSIINHLNPDGPHIVFYKDSYTNSMAPFIALLCSRVDLLDPRDYKDKTLRFIQEASPDYFCVTVSAGMGEGFFDLDA